MKTPEDEAWEEMERRQGAGGFPAKRAMARARMDDDDDTQDYKRPWVGLTDEQRLAALVAIDPLTARLPRGLKQFAEAIEKLLKDQNV